MREIKFRVWNTRNKSFIKDEFDPNFWVNPFNFKTWMEFRPDLDGETVFESKEELFIFQQYTGLRDANGKEIYEGDLLSRGEEYNNVSVDFRSGCFWCGLLPLYQEVRFLKVIGNIYETKL